MTTEDVAAAHDSSTTALIDRYRAPAAARADEGGPPGSSGLADCERASATIRRRASGSSRPRAPRHHSHHTERRSATLARTPRNWTGARTPSGLKRVRQAERRHEILQPRRSAAKTLVAKALTVATAPARGRRCRRHAERGRLGPRSRGEGRRHPPERRRAPQVAPDPQGQRRHRRRAPSQTAGHVAKTTGKAAAAKAAKARIAAGKAGKAKGAQTAAGKARAALSKTARAEAARGRRAGRGRRRRRTTPRQGRRAKAAAKATATKAGRQGDGHEGRAEGDRDQGRAEGDRQGAAKPAAKAPPRRPPEDHPRPRRPSSPRSTATRTPRSPTGAFSICGQVARRAQAPARPRVRRWRRLRPGDPVHQRRPAERRRPSSRTNVSPAVDTAGPSRSRVNDATSVTPAAASAGPGPRQVALVDAVGARSGSVERRRPVDAVADSRCRRRRTAP